MTNKLFIVRYVLFDNDFCEKIDEKVNDEIDTFFRNSSIESDNREGFDDIIDFDVIFAQNIDFFDVAKSVANKIIKRVDDEVSDEISDEVTNDFENEINSLNINDTSFLNINFASFVANFF